MNEQIKEAIVLLGGDSANKSMLKFGNYTLLKNKINHIILASDKEYPVNDGFIGYAEWNIESYPKGTGGAVMSAIDKLKTDYFYLMNIDDVCAYNPISLMEPVTQCRILVSKPKIPYGKIELRQELVIGFKEKPLTDYYVSAGHYVFKKHIVEKYFPDNGNLEDMVLPQLSRERLLENYRLSGKWVSINTNRDYEEAKQLLGVQ
jgi:NDP-sugar pyrophosphorylase family protein